MLAQFFSWLPKNVISIVTGWLVQLEWPPPFHTVLCKAFVFAFGINMQEAEKPIEEYRTIEEVFTRALKEGSRAIEGEFVSPADGVLSYSLPVEDQDKGMQVKGIDYSLHELVRGDEPDDGSINYTWQSLVYLAPHNYHRVHAPLSGKLVSMRHIPGDLWPVNQTFVDIIPDLFVSNERLVFELSLEGGGQAAVVMVGALNVGRIVSPFWDEIVTNDRLFGTHVRDKVFTPAAAMIAGEEIGTFMLGSTAIVLLDEKAQARLQPKRYDEKVDILMGQNISEVTR